MQPNIFAIRIVLTNGYEGYFKFNGDGTWGWSLVEDVNEASYFRTQQEAIQEYRKHVTDYVVDQYGNKVYVDRSRCTITSCYNPGY